MSKANPPIVLMLMLVILGASGIPEPGGALDGEPSGEEAIGLAVSTGTRGEILPCT